MLYVVAWHVLLSSPLMFVSFPISTLLRTSFHCSLSSPPDWNIATVSGFLFFTSITSVLI